VVYVYFYESIFSRQIYSYGFHIFKLNNLKVIHDFIFSMFDPNLVQNDFLYGYRESIKEYVLLGQSQWRFLKVLLTLNTMVWHCVI
jgi:hypothetical protein